MGQEVCKGIKVNHYTVDASNLTPELGNLKINQAQGDIYLAVDGNYLIHYNFKMGGQVIVVPGKADFGQGTLELTGDMTGSDFSTPVDCQKCALLSNGASQAIL